MKTKAAVLWGGQNEKWQVEEIDLDPPGEGEVLIKLTASGLCHSDEHLVTGDLPFPPYRSWEGMRRRCRRGSRGERRRHFRG